MSHFASSDEPDKHTTLKQIDTFEEATRGLPGIRSLSNSGAVLAWPQAARDWARLGILLYGADPLPQPTEHLIPVMTLQSEVFAERWLEPGESIGYGGKFVTDTKTRVGLVAIGYADGYPRQVPSGTPVSVDGALTRIIGRVSMDMLFADLTDLPEADTALGGPVRSNVSAFRALDWQDYFANTRNGVILCDTKSRALHFWSEDQSVYRLYPTSVPLTDDLTRLGKTEVIQKVENPTWRPTPSGPSPIWCLGCCWGTTPCASARWRARPDAGPLACVG
jgi:alanine racemase